MCSELTGYCKTKVMDLTILCGNLRKTLSNGTHKTLPIVIRKLFKKTAKQTLTLYRYNEEKSEWSNIKCSDVKDKDTLKVVFRKVDELNNSQQIENDCIVIKDSDLIQKLKNNETLNDGEREYLVALLTKKSTNKGRNKGIQTEQLELQTAERPPRDISEVISWMKQEFKKPDKEQNKDMINKCMSATYPDRRSFILTGLPKITAIKDVYPFLFNNKQMILEFERIMPGSKENFFCNLMKYGRIILDLAPDSSDVKMTVNIAEKEQDLDEIVVCGAALLLLPVLLEEVPSFVYFAGEEPIGDNDSALPRIECSGKITEVLLNEAESYRVVVEDELICKTKTFVDAFLAFFASFYIFDISYFSQCNNTLITTERLLCEINTTPYTRRAREVCDLLRKKSGKT